MAEVDWDKVLIHCSSIGVLFVEPKSAEAKKNGELSETAKSHLIRIYIKEYWGRERRIETKQMKKGTVNEHEGIAMLSRIDGFPYVKNEERRSNDYITGICDIDYGEYVDDTKLSWDAESFLAQLGTPLDKLYEFQNRGYMWLWEKPKARTRYCLVDADETAIMDEKKKIFYQYGCATTESPEYLIAEKEVEHNMKFWDIPESERVITKTVTRDLNIEAQIASKVIKARKFLKELHERHTSLNKK